MAASSAAEEKLSPQIDQVINGPRFKQAHWGILVVDLKSGEVIYEHDADKLFAPASTTKLYSVATALDQLGADFRFRTPIYQRGTVDAKGRLDGDLILVASGDPTLGGRTNERGEIEFTDHDHTYANSNARTELTPTDPLAGLDELARQVAASGIKAVAGEVIIDARLFDDAVSTGSGPSRITPILVNDNVIDVLIRPSAEGSPAQVDWRPRTGMLVLDAKVDTKKPGAPVKIEMNHEPGVLRVRGQVGAGSDSVIRVHEVDEPVDWARGLLIEALARAGIDVKAQPREKNRSALLPNPNEYDDLKRIALLVSPPFAENARLILKVSHNLHASTLPLLVAARQGKRTLTDGLRIEHAFLKKAGVAVDQISFAGAAGGANADFTSPRATVALLRYMASRPDFATYERALPILGIDGTLADAVDRHSPARGKAQAKTGTLYWYNVLKDRYLLTSKALAGYLTAKSGRRLAFCFLVNGVHLKQLEERNKIGKTLGQLAELVFESQ